MARDLWMLYQECNGQLFEKGDFVGYDDSDPMHAEITAGAQAEWVIVETWPGHDGQAAQKLAERRFGIYMPETEQYEVRRGRKVKVARPMFPGYIFVFVFDVGRHAARIQACPGVARIMLSESGTQFATLPDQAINLIRIEENRRRPIELPCDPWTGFRAERKLRRHRKGYRKTMLAPPEGRRIDDTEIISVRTWSAFSDGLATAVDGDERNQLLRKALGLPLQPPA
jgi:transcription antitermination factor NusG